MSVKDPERSRRRAEKRRETEMARTLTFTINGNLPSKNRLDRMHYHVVRKLRNSWFWKIKEALRKANFKYNGNTSYFKEKVRVDLLVAIKDRRSEKDRANIISAADKLIIDLLFETKKRSPAARILVDDDPDNLEWGNIEQIVGKPAVKVTLTEMIERDSGKGSDC